MSDRELVQRFNRRDLSAEELRPTCSHCGCKQVDGQDRGSIHGGMMAVDPAGGDITWTWRCKPCNDLLASPDYLHGLTIEAEYMDEISSA